MVADDVDDPAGRVERLVDGLTGGPGRAVRRVVWLAPTTAGRTPADCRPLQVIERSGYLSLLFCFYLGTLILHSQAMTSHLRNRSCLLYVHFVNTKKCLLWYLTLWLLFCKKINLEANIFLQISRRTETGHHVDILLLVEILFLKIKSNTCFLQWKVNTIFIYKERTLELLDSAYVLDFAHFRKVYLPWPDLPQQFILENLKTASTINRVWTIKSYEQNLV